MKQSASYQIFTPYSRVFQNGNSSESSRSGAIKEAYPFVNDGLWSQRLPEVCKAVAIEVQGLDGVPFVAHVGSAAPVLSALPELVDRGVKNIWLLDQDPIVGDMNKAILRLMFSGINLPFELHLNSLSAAATTLTETYGGKLSLDAKLLMQAELNSLGQRHYLNRRQEVRRALGRCNFLISTCHIGSSAFHETAAALRARNMKAVWVSTTNVGNWMYLGSSEETQLEYEAGLYALPNAERAIFTYSSFQQRSPELRPPDLQLPVLGVQSYFNSLSSALADFRRSRF